MTISKVVFIKTTDQLTDKPVYTPVDWEYWSKEKQFLKEVARGATDDWRSFSIEGMLRGVKKSWYWVVRGENGCHYPLPFILETRPGKGCERFQSAKIQLLKELMG